MHRLAVLSLAAYAGSVFLDAFTPFGPGAGSLSRLIGYVAFTICLAAMFSRRGIIKPDPGHVLLSVFVVYNLFTALWSIDFDMTLERISMYAMQLVFLWIALQTIETSEDRNIVMGGYALGAVLASAANLVMFYSGHGLEASTASSAFGRYAANGGDPNEFALSVDLSLPMAWYLGFSAQRPYARVLFRLMPLVMIPGVLLTGSRGGAISLAVSLLVIPLCRKETGKLTQGAVLAILLAAVTTGVSLLPPEDLKRLLSIGSEVAGGSMAGRREIWAAGWEQFKHHPFFGVGLGEFAESISIASQRQLVAHNTYLSIATELGLCGFAVFLLCLGRLLYIVFGLPKPDRFVWGTVLLAWMVGVCSLTLEQSKPTWLIFALILIQGRLLWQQHGSSRQQPSIAEQQMMIGLGQ